MEFTYVTSGPAGFFRLAGGLTVDARFDDLRAAIGAFPDRRVRGIFLDLGRTTQLDCAGIGELIRLRALAIAAGRTFGLVNVGHRPRRLLEIARLDALLGLYDNTTDALRSVAPATNRGASGITRSSFTLLRSPLAVSREATT